MSDRPDLAERYGRAIGSSHLELRDVRCDVDYLIAAGFVQRGLGVSLFRLAAEWDLAAGSYRIARHHAKKVQAQALQLQRNAFKYPKDMETLMKQAAALLAQAERESMTARALALIHLTTLHEAKESLGGFACWLATKRRFMESDALICALAAKAIQLWLDSICHACGGRGFTIVMHGPVVICKECGGSARIRWQEDHEDSHAKFIHLLMAEMDRKCSAVAQAMSRALSQQEPMTPAKQDPVALEALQRRLFALRSSSAEQD